MPKTTDLPEKLRPFASHGLDLDVRGSEAVCDCPWCGREGKFSVNCDTGQWRCFVCAEGSDKGGGNVLTFLRLLHERSEAATTDTAALAKDRRLLYSDTPVHWSLAKSAITGEWLVPGYAPDGRLSQLYRWVKNIKTGKRALYATAGLPIGIYGVPLYDPDRPTVYICEGPWDAMALWEALRHAKRAKGGGLEPTGSEAASLLADASVLAAPGCSSFDEKWAGMLAGKSVVICFDSDRPREAAGKPVPPAGMAGAKRLAGLLAGAEQPPRTIQWVEWGPDGYDPELPDGADVRDVLAAGGDGLPERLAALRGLLDRVKPIPPNWIAGRTPAAQASGGCALELRECTSWREVMEAWHDGFEMTRRIVGGVACSLAVGLGTRLTGSPLWMKILGPPSCGKSTIAESLSCCTEFAFANSNFSGFYSGWKTDGAGEEDHSFIAKVANKTLVTKDGDTILKSAHRQIILSQARDLYDCVSRVHYGNAIHREYAARISWLLYGTEALREIDQSELGQRFLDYQMAVGIDHALERRVGLRVGHRTVRNIAVEAGDEPENRQDADMTAIKQVTGGYLAWLRRNATRILSEVAMDDATLERIVSLAKFVAYMRSRPAKDEEKLATREFSTRLIEQLTKLAMCLAAVMNKREVDADVMDIVQTAAEDTARGRTLAIGKALAACGKDGSSLPALSLATGEPEGEERKLVRFLCRIGAVKAFRRKKDGVVSQTVRYRLSDDLAELWAEVFPEGATEDRGRLC